MTTTTILLVFLFSLGAAFVQRVSGFGFGIFIMTVLPYLMPSYAEATTLSGSLALVTSIIIVSRMWKFIEWRKLIPILLTFLVVSFISIQFVSLAGDGLLKRILGGVLILAALWFLFISKHISLKPTMFVQISMGTISGVMGGFFGMQGPPAVLYILSCTEKKDNYMALAQTYFLIGNTMMTIFRASNGHFTTTVAQGWCYGIVAVLLGTWIGAKVFRLIPIAMLRKIIYIYMAISGLVALLS